MLAVFRQHLYSDWSALVGRRLAVLCPLFSAGVPFALANLEPRLLLVPMSIRTIVIKTICNSWCTSSRYHEAIQHHCIFGCNACQPCAGSPAFDQLCHYLICPRLWSIVAQVSGLPIGSTACARLGVSMEWIDLRLLALAHHIYHTLKLGNENMLGTCTSYSRWARVLDFAVVAAKIGHTELFLVNG